MKNVNEYTSSLVWLIWICWALFIMQIFKLEKKGLFCFCCCCCWFLLLPLGLKSAQKPLHQNDCLHEIRPRHSPTTIPLLLLHHAFQGSLLLWDYEEGIHILPLVQTQLHAYSYRATLAAEMELVSKSRWHIRVTPNSAWPLQCVKATRSMTSAPAMEDWSLSRCLAVIAFRHGQDTHMFNTVLSILLPLGEVKGMKQWKQFNTVHSGHGERGYD